MRISQREVHHFALEFGAISHADDVEIFFETLRHAEHGVRHQRSRETMQRRQIIARTNRMQLGALLLETDSPRQIHTQLALWSLHFDRAGANLNLYSRGYGYRFSSNA